MLYFEIVNFNKNLEMRFVEKYFQNDLYLYYFDEKFKIFLNKSIINLKQFLLKI